MLHMYHRDDAECSPGHGCEGSNSTLAQEIAPRLDVDQLDLSPFSECFSDLLEDGRAPLNVVKQATHNLFAEPSPQQSNLSYDVEVKDVKDFIDRADYSEIDEVMIISPKNRAQNATPSPSSETRATDIEAFEMLHVIASNRDSTTHLCRERGDFKLYNVKVFNKNRTSMANRFKRVYSEQNILRKIEELRHSFLPSLFSNFQDEVSIYFITDFYPEGNLHDHINRDSPLSPDNVFSYACEIVSAIAALHDAGITHRNLKPENIMIDGSGHIVVTGFECAKMPIPRGAACCGDMSELGAKGYQAPELFLGWMHDFSVDCWSFGAILYMMLFASHPFVAENEYHNNALLQTKVIHCALSFPTFKSSQVGWVARDLITKCLERNPAVRLGINEIKSHDYFATVNWESVAAKDVTIPALPTICSNRSSTPNLQGFNKQQSPAGVGFDSFTPVPQRIIKHNFMKQNHVQDVTNVRTQRRISGQSNERNASRLEIVLEASEEEIPPDHMVTVGNTRASRCNDFKNVSKPAEPMSLWDNFGTAAASALDVITSTPAPTQRRRLRKRQSSINREGVVSSLTIGSVTHSGNKLRRGSRPTSNPALKATHDSSSSIHGTVQGIGISKNPPAARSRLSLCSSTFDNCQNLLRGGIPALRRKFSMHSIKKSSARRHPPSPEEPEMMNIMREIHGSSWSLGATPVNSSSIPVNTLVTPTSVDSPTPETPSTPELKVTPKDKAGDRESTLRLVSSSGLRLFI